MNPYEPPPNDLHYAPFWKRFRNAIGRALREYRAGLVRDKFTRRDHVKAWVVIFFIASTLLLICVGLIAEFLQFFFKINIPI